MPPKLTRTHARTHPRTHARMQHAPRSEPNSTPWYMPAKSAIMKRIAAASEGNIKFNLMAVVKSRLALATAAGDAAAVAEEEAKRSRYKKECVGYLVDRIFLSVPLSCLSFHPPTSLSPRNPPQLHSSPFSQLSRSSLAVAAANPGTRFARTTGSRSSSRRWKPWPGAASWLPRARAPRRR